MVDLVCGSLILEQIEGCNIAQSSPSSSNTTVNSSEARI